MAQATAARLLADLPRRWAHVVMVTATLRSVAAPGQVVAAGWLHDVGYAESVVRTGLHSLDGARHLAATDWAPSIVSLVAYHTGAEYEAAERGLTRDLDAFERPSQDELDLLTWADLTSSPSGERVSVDARLAEILNRYPPRDPVHIAVARASDYLRACAARGLQLADVGRSATQSVLDS
jgi:hypothetical protein